MREELYSYMRFLGSDFTNSQQDFCHRFMAPVSPYISITKLLLKLLYRQRKVSISYIRWWE